MEGFCITETEIHKYCLKGSILFAESFRTYQKKEYKKCFFLLGNAVEAYNAAASARERGNMENGQVSMRMTA